MQVELKKKWVKALRSGKFKQGSGELYNSEDNTYCCLGVLGICKGMPHENLDHDDLLHGMFSHGLSEGIQMELAELNDSNVPFPVIAGFINENL